MDGDELIRKLCDPEAIKEQYMEQLFIMLSYHQAQKEAMTTGESPEYAEYIENLHNKFVLEQGMSPEQAKTISLILNLNLVLFHLIADNNQRLLSLIMNRMNR